jgi:hypothetical protein
MNEMTPPPATAHEAGTCGGYYKCGICAAIVSAAKLEVEASPPPSAYAHERRGPAPADDRSRDDRRAHRSPSREGEGRAPRPPRAAPEVQVSAPVAPSDRVLAAVRAGWARFERTRILPTYWHELAFLDELERQAVREVLRDWAVWLAGAPLGIPGVGRVR